MENKLQNTRQTSLSKPEDRTQITKHIAIINGFVNPSFPIPDQTLELWTNIILAQYPFLTPSEIRSVINSFATPKRQFNLATGVKNILDAIHEDIIQPRIRANEKHLQSVRCDFLECNQEFSIQYILQFKPFPFPELTPKI